MKKLIAPAGSPGQCAVAPFAGRGLNKLSVRNADAFIRD